MAGTVAGPTFDDLFDKRSGSFLRLLEPWFLKRRFAMKAYEEIIKKLNLSKHDEGGYFCQTYKSDLIVRPQIGSYTRSSATHIYYFLSRGCMTVRE
jgi:hypothetical protein